ncbi:MULTISPECIES: hypothetical protein [unclassified Curtobacterium]|uniref:hypothetical protein n=1 Tax=unclassified Curtobacterium TaxID=257496 RepID=UPI0008DCD7EC|nr:MULTISPECIES: hypothetical protein [unclassified Curtobacterium]WIA96650.1 hypothetical protein QOL16_16380 [Curtobacterium sp. MCBA15_004]WIA99955.1 hypothetical protein QOL15_15820 [Curtobacterium sp. MCBA15_012]
MSVQLLANIVIGLALVGYLAYRQATWRSVDPTRVWRAPLVLGAVGLVVLAQSAAAVTTLDVLFLGVEALVSIGAGLAMGAMTRFRTAAPDTEGRTLQARTGWAGAGLWVVLIVVRIGLDVLGGHLGAHLLTSTGAVLLVLALNRAARALVVDQRIPRPATGMMVR